MTEQEAIAEATKREKAKSKQLGHMEWQAVEENGDWKAKLVKIRPSLQEAENQRREDIRRENEMLDTDMGNGMTLRGIGMATQIFGPEAVAMALAIRARSCGKKE